MPLVKRVEGNVLTENSLGEVLSAVKFTMSTSAVEHQVEVRGQLQLCVFISNMFEIMYMIYFRLRFCLKVLVLRTSLDIYFRSPFSSLFL